MQIFHWGF